MDGSTRLDPLATKWLVSDRVLVEAGRELEPLAIGVDGSEIVALAEPEVVRRAAPDGLLDFGSRPLAPTFVNGHVHLAMAPLRGIASVQRRLGDLVADVFFQIERHLTEADVFVFSKLGAYESLLAGVGEVWDHYYFGEAVARALLEVGLTGVVAPTLQDEGGPFSDRVDEEFAAALCIHENPRYGRAGIRAALGPHATDTVSDRLFRRVAETASSLRLPVHLHLAQSEHEMEVGQRRGGVAARALGFLQGCSVLAAHGIYLSRKEIETLVEAQWVLGFCPLSQVQFGTLGPARPWLEAGGALTIGTDCVASNDALSVQRELPWLGAQNSLWAGFSEPKQRLLQTGDASWVRGAEVNRVEMARDLPIEANELLRVGFGGGLVGLGARARGTIALKAPANFQVLDPDAPELYPGDDLSRRLAYGDTAPAIHALVVGGKLVGEPGHFRQSLVTSPAYKETLAEARRRRSELFERAGLKA